MPSNLVADRARALLNVIGIGFEYCKDRRLYIYRPFLKAFVDDIIIYLATEEEHLEHLRLVLTLLRRSGLSLSAKKSFLGYHGLTC